MSSKLALKYYYMEGLQGVKLVRETRVKNKKKEDNLCIYVGPTDNLVEFLSAKVDGSKIRLDGYRADNGELKYTFDEDVMQQIFEPNPDAFEYKKRYQDSRKRALLFQINEYNESCSMFLKFDDELLYVKYIGYDSYPPEEYFSIHELDEANIFDHNNIQIINNDIENEFSFEFEEMIEKLKKSPN